MAAIAHNPGFAKKVGVPQSVGKDFNDADKGKTFKKGGEMKKMESMKEDTKQDKAIVKKAFAMHDKQEHKGGKGTDLAKLKKGGMPMKKMASGGKVKETMGPRTMAKDVEKGSNTKLAHGEHGIQKKGHTRAMMPKMKGKTI